MSIQPKTPQFGSAYIRVSTDDQVELSPESQLEEIRKYAQREGILLLEDQIYIDAGISGKKAERRPEFMRMIATAKSPDCPFSVILLWNTPASPGTRRKASSTNLSYAPNATSTW